MNEQPQMQRDTFSEVRDLVLSTVHMHHVNPATLSAETPITRGGLELDSVEVLEVVVAVEQHFKIKVENAEVGKKHFQTLGSIASYVDSQRSVTGR